MRDVNLPAADTEEQYEALDEQALRPGVQALCAHLGLKQEPERFAEGSLPVYAVNDTVSSTAGAMSSWDGCTAKR